ncbi:hypothetical protein [Chitinophaga agri]|uniref:Uncharacterized protein n=1 Tax=Chitinophaga agri TaxID=2703787 RepID=A0A6B9ZIB7_9BACT|nr:hypothetical protein [Chitinophaga agri]QHS61251.1 hypothetical protein GWR21_17095 [Chitinophaga agri]
MKYHVKTINSSRCHITLLPENDVDENLLRIRDEEERDAKAFTFEWHYQSALTNKFGIKAHLTAIHNHHYPSSVFADYIVEGHTIGNV